jgi:DNA-binding XRE family transcriptional regulator
MAWNTRVRKTVSTGKIQAERDTLKAARVWLRLDQEQLAKAAGLTRETVSNFEGGRTAPHESTRGAIQSALETRGIVFTNGDKPGFHYDKEKAVIPKS